MFPGLGRWGCPCSASRASCKQRPHPVPTSPRTPPFQRCVVTSWGPGVHGASWVHVRGLSRSPQRHKGNPQPLLDKGCSRLCFSGVTEPDASNPPAGPDLQWLWGLPGPDARLQASEAAAKGGGAGIFSFSHLLSGSRASGAISLGIMLHSWLGPRIL